MGSKCCKKEKDPIHGYPIGHELHFHSNEMQELEIENKEGNKRQVVVARYLENFYAFDTDCPHSGAKLASGAFRHGKIRCQWHGACYDATTGDIEDFPGLECIQTFKVTKTRGGFLKIQIRKSEFAKKRYLKPLCRKANLANQGTIPKPIGNVPALQTFVIIGSGAAGFTCAVTLRQNNFEGRIIMITRDWFHPYDRTKLTKVINNHWIDIKLQEETFYVQHDIEVLTNTTIEKVNFTDSALKVANSNTIINYNKLLIATGLKPRVYDVEGSQLDNIFTIHSLKDAQRVFIKAQGKRVVILGTSFIAMEMACILDHMAASVTVVCKAKWPFGVLYGRRVGVAILVHMMKNSRRVRFKMLDEVRCFKGNAKGEVTSVVTLKKIEYPCDVVVVAIGAVANTEFLENTALKLLVTDKSIPVGRYMKTMVPNVFAAGDVVTFPSAVSVSGHAAIAHWGVACKLGQIAALNMLGIKAETFYIVPFHWTSLWGKSIRYCGNGSQYNEVLIFGNLTAMTFCALYRRDGIIIAAATCNCDPIAAELAFDLQHHVRYHRDEYPPYITDIFPDPPNAGEQYVWVKFTTKETGLMVAADDARHMASQPRDMTRAEVNVTRALDFDTDKEREIERQKRNAILKKLEQLEKPPDKSKKLKHLQPIDRDLEHRKHHI